MKFNQGQLPCDLNQNDNIYQLVKAHYELLAAYVWAGVDPELDFKRSLNAKLDFGGPSLSFSCEKSLNTIVCYRRHCRFGESYGSPGPTDQPLCMGIIELQYVPKVLRDAP